MNSAHKDNQGVPEPDETLSEVASFSSVIRLLERTIGSASPQQTIDARRPVLLDLGGRIASFARAAEDTLGVHYVGLAIDEASLESLVAAGFEARMTSIGQPAILKKALETSLDGRVLTAVTMLDTLEYLPNDQEVLEVINRFLASRAAPLVISVPNTTHRDIGYKLAFGAWDYAQSGLLDAAQVRLFGEVELSKTLLAAGLHRTDREDFLLAVSNQHFPANHPALMRGTSLNAWLNNLREQAAPAASVSKFVWACLPGPVIPRVLVRPSGGTDRPQGPFLSVLIRTQGRRPQPLAEVLLCLAGQTDQDFEVLVLAHYVSMDEQISLNRLIEGQPRTLRTKIRVVLVDFGSRATVLNEGFARAFGDYVVALDDDDLVFANWVEAFRTVSRKHPGKVLRSIASHQLADVVPMRDAWIVRAEGPITTPYDREFSLVGHLASNGTPFMTAAFPRGLFAEMGFRFDESLTTLEDWDFLLHCASMVGVADSLRLTAIYHSWISQDSSQTEHDVDEWLLNQYSIDRKIDALPMLLPPGETRTIREGVRRIRGIESATPPDQLTSPNRDSSIDERPALAHRLATLQESRSWKVSAPLRALSRLRGATAPIKLSTYLGPSSDEAALRTAIDDVLTSRSWRLTSWLRRRR